MEPNSAEMTAILVQIAMGVSLAACAGLRAFLPLLAVGAAGRLGWVSLDGSFEWLATWPALTVFAVAVVTELAGDKFPVVDHFLDSTAGWVKPIAGFVLVAGVVTELGPLQSSVVAILLGSSTAGAVHLGKSSLRLASTATTAGTANPLISFGEDLLALVGTVVSLAVPLLALLALLIVALGLWWLARRLRRRRPVAA